MALELVPCPLCDERTAFLPVTIPDHDDHIRGYGDLYAGRAKSEWKICGRCGFVHQNPRPSIAALNAYYLSGLYHPPADVDPRWLLEVNAPAYRDELDFAIAHSGLARGSVFDIGCGRGVALKLWRDRGFEPYGVEPDRSLFEYGRRHWGLEHTQNRVLDETIDVTPVDLAFSHHALEHVADLRQLMLGLRAVVRPGGYVFTALPTYRRNRSTMSKLWMNSGHYSLFTVRSLNQLFARHGFTEIAHRYEHWVSSPDQFGHVARFTNDAIDPAQFYEDPQEVAYYLRVTNPLRSLVYYPRYGGYRRRLAAGAVLAKRTFDVLRHDPASLPRRARAYLAWRRTRA